MSAIAIVKADRRLRLADVGDGLAQLAFATGSTGTALDSVVNTGTFTVLTWRQRPSADDAAARRGDRRWDRQFADGASTATAALSHADVMSFVATARRRTARDG